MRSEESRRQGAKFRAWLLDEMAVRRWKQADLARAADVGQTAVSKWLNVKRLPTYETCQAIARALNVSEETVLAHAGVSIAKPVLTPLQSDIMAMVRVLPEEMLPMVRAQLRALVSEQVQAEIQRELHHADASLPDRVPPPKADNDAPGITCGHEGSVKSR